MTPRTRNQPKDDQLESKQFQNKRVQKPPPSLADSEIRKKRRDTAKKTRGLIRPISKALHLITPPNGYKATSKNTEPLKSTTNYFPDLNPITVKVVRGDTFDTAVTLENARELMGCQDTQKICVLNFANAKDIGGGWLNGAMAQEEELCYRSTLSATLKPRFYPLGELAAVYSPNVVIFRENYAKNHSLMWHETPELLPVVSVISIAATDRPVTTLADDGQEKYLNTFDRDMMKDKMRLILRVAGHSGHRRLVLGAFGCGVFKNPKHDVAHCWAEVLKEDEFKGWWEVIVFAILGKKADSVDGADLTLQIFRSILDNLQV